MFKTTVSLSHKWKDVWLSAILLLMSVSLFAQQKITGTVRNASNAPIENATVTVKAKKATTINAQGTFSTTAAEGLTLTASVVGFQTP
ncbi:carboxypeptidase-like regulatory domain-containing protein [Flavisolibacter ginsenosidimutans]|uniref:Carboxypeptidase regulatory-like domain-containing protein n=1 Tax=Flavisolibacter ginsenosidimutans TaxID=661481 RepID=A0A5B8UEP0_9BACT|nr:carboxypeptidase-like regulatory domain-containing protein [Flavisolibacter ginsenosidimutans]QEC54570.1 carboxypeptidase regulatory-like domain-containing protein [Flavisolibacter ginsenosidimutans]